MTAARFEIDAAIEAGDWGEDPDAAAQAAFAAAAVETGLTGAFRISLLFADDAAVKVLNRDWRGKDKATNVLSFPGPPGLQPDGMRHLGDIALAAGTIRREALAENKSFEAHLTHLLVHGFLHLIGHDHEIDAEAEAMEALERAILARLAIADPYAIEGV